MMKNLKFMHKLWFLFIAITLNNAIIAQSISGVYNTDFKEMTLSQNGNAVTGTYKYMDGRISGTLNGNVLIGTWIQSNSKGRLKFEFNSDFTSFNGLWSYDNTEPASKWNGKKISSLTNQQITLGTYATDFKNMTLTHKGNLVTGTYEYMDGKISGTLIGNVLTGNWIQSNSKGRFVFVFSGDFSSFNGKWSYDNAEPASIWNGKRIGSNPIETIVLGTYNTDFKELTLTRTGNSISGTYKYMDGKVSGTLNGNVLTGIWTQSNSKGRLRFEFAPDFSSFKGTWGYDNAEPASIWNGKRK